jgi:PQQ-dependent dehydrogenase (methanol/ethanol family)
MNHPIRLLACLLLAAISFAQNPPALTPQLVEAGQKAFRQNCAACHGPDADGSDQGPRLTANRRLRSRSVDQLRRIIKDGMPSSGMPAFPLPAPELDALVAYVRSLNSTAAESAAPGSAAAGEQFFFAKGQCANCHMIRGRGKAVGPDLSNVARELTMGELRESLVRPDARIAPGYRTVTVRLRDGKSIRGFARGRTNFDVQLQTLDGHFHLLQAAQIASIDEDARSLMPALKATGDEQRDLIAYLSSLTGVKQGVANAEQRPTAGDIDFARIRNPKPGDWLTYNGNLNGNRYSNLKQIDRGNVGKLALQWVFPVDHYGLELTPIVADGVMYITGPNQAYALDALSGRLIWKYARPRTQGLIGDASLGTNRGVAIYGDKVFMVTDNAHLLALNRVTGSLVWDVYMPEKPMHYGSTVAPLIVNDTVVAGVSGGDRGMRGFLVCYKASTGERLWRRWTIPFKGEPGSETWGVKDPEEGGGATWLTGAYDPETETIFWPTGNPFPDSDDRDRPGDNLFSNCILAINPHTGAIKWHYQFTPHDVHDWDATEPPLLIDTEYQGKPRKLLLHADRNGFFYVLDRTDGKVLLAKAFARQTWTRGIGPDGRPLPPPEEPSPLDCPGSASNWNSAVYSPATRLFYVLAQDECRVNRRLRTNWKGGEPKLDPTQKFIRAINIDTGKIAWELPFIGEAIPKTWPGLVGTTGGLLFFGDPNGAFAAADERDGKVLWSYPTNVYMKASPMTFAIDGRQFVAIAAGPNIMCFGLPTR